LHFPVGIAVTCRFSTKRPHQWKCLRDERRRRATISPSTYRENVIAASLPGIEISDCPLRRSRSPFVSPFDGSGELFYAAKFFDYCPDLVKLHFAANGSRPCRSQGVVAWGVRGSGDDGECRETPSTLVHKGVAFSVRQVVVDDRQVECIAYGGLGRCEGCAHDNLVAREEKPRGLLGEHFVVFEIKDSHVNHAGNGCQGMPGMKVCHW